MDPTNSIWEGRTSSHGTTHEEAAVSECGTCVAYFKRRWTNKCQKIKFSTGPEVKRPTGNSPDSPHYPPRACTHTHILTYTVVIHKSRGQYTYTGIFTTLQDASRTNTHTHTHRLTHTNTHSPTNTHSHTPTEQYRHTH